MAAVPILSRAGETIGVIVLHTRAPHEFGEDTPEAARRTSPRWSAARSRTPSSMTSERRRVDALTGLSELAQQVAAAPDAGDAGRGARRAAPRRCSAPTPASCCASRPTASRACCSPRIPRPLPAPALDHGRRGDAGRAGEPLGARPARRGAGAVARSRPGRRAGRRRWRPAASASGCCACASRRARAFGDEDAEIARAIAHLAAVAIKRAELIEGLTNANIDQGPVRGARRRGDDVRRRQGRRGPLRPHRPVPDAVRAEPAGARGAVLGRVARRRRGARPRAGRARAAVGDRGRARPGPRAAGASARRAAQPSSGLLRECARAGPGPRRGRSASASCATRPPTPPAPTARPATRPPSPTRCCATAARSPTRRSAPTATWSRSAPTTPRATGCAPPSTCSSTTTAAGAPRCWTRSSATCPSAAA